MVDLQDLIEQQLLAAVAAIAAVAAVATVAVVAAVAAGYHATSSKQRLSLKLLLQ